MIGRSFMSTRFVSELSFGSVFALCLAVSLVGGAQAGESMETMIPNSGIDTVEISPTGHWVAAVASRGQLAGLLIQRVGNPDVINVKTSRDPIVAIHWIGPDALVVTFSTDAGRVSLVERFQFIAGKTTFRESKISAPGWLVAPLPLVPDTVVWAFDDRQKTRLRRLQVKDLIAFREELSGRLAISLPGEKVAESNAYGRYWVLDRLGNARAYLLVKGDRYSFFAKPDAASSFRKIAEFDVSDSDAFIRPVAIAEDGESLLVFAYAGRDTLGLHEFDVLKKSFGAPVLVRPDVDIKGVLTDELSGAVIAGVYEVDGQESHEYLEGYQQKFLRDFESRFDRDEIRVYSGTLDRRLFVFRVAGPRNPGDFYLRDRKANRNVLIAQAGALIDRDQLAKSEKLVVESEDGTEIEAFLTIPKIPAVTGKGHPLVVMPHGGPIGVRDSRIYDPLVQYLASWGFAVLQPNYRGSSGYGRAFERAGRKEWARGIEDDIDAAVNAVLGRPQIDEDRVCIAGGSYGGFSALASVVRHQDRYRCAISWNGVSDIPLMLDSSDFADSEDVSELFAEAAGDVATERERMIAASPAYHVDEIETPMFLIYGTEDRRVDPDHSHRVLLIAETLGKQFDVLEVEKMAHSPSRTEFVIVARAMRRFLTQHLIPHAEFVPDPVTAAEETGEFQPRFILGR